MNGPLTYLAGPYSSDPERNTARAIEALHHLLDAGVPAICPHLSHLAETHRARDYEDWMALDLRLLERCDVLVRLPGDSAGADREVAHARHRGIPVGFLPDGFDLACLPGIANYHADPIECFCYEPATDELGECRSCRRPVIGDDDA